MNKCCKSLFYKGLSLSKDSNNFRVLSTMLNYSASRRNKIYFPYEKKFSSNLFVSKMPVLFIHSHKNHLARNSKKNTHDKKSNSNHVSNIEKETRAVKKGDIDHLFKPVMVNPILTVDKDNIGVQLGGNISKRINFWYFYAKASLYINLHYNCARNVIEASF